MIIEMSTLFFELYFLQFEYVS